MGNTLQGITTVTTNIEQALQLSLNEHQDDGLLLSQKHMLESLEELASLKTYIICCGAKEEVYTGKWENIAEKWREVERLQIFEAPCTTKEKHASACTQRIEHVCASTFYNSLSDINISRPLILPSSYTGSDRFMQQLFQDSMAIVRHFGKPSLFITFTANPRRPEILNHLEPRQQPTVVSPSYPNLNIRHIFLLLRDTQLPHLSSLLLLQRLTTAPLPLAAPASSAAGAPGSTNVCVAASYLIGASPRAIWTASQRTRWGRCSVRIDSASM